MQIYLYTVLKNSGVVEVIDNSRNSEPNHENREINYTCSPVEENLGSTAGAEVQEEGGGVIRGVTEQSYCRCGNSKRGAGCHQSDQQALRRWDFTVLVLSDCTICACGSTG